MSIGKRTEEFRPVEEFSFDRVYTVDKNILELPLCVYCVISFRSYDNRSVFFEKQNLLIFILLFWNHLEGDRRSNRRPKRVENCKKYPIFVSLTGQFNGCQIPVRGVTIVIPINSSIQILQPTCEKCNCHNDGVSCCS